MTYYPFIDLFTNLLGNLLNSFKFDNLKTLESKKIINEE